MSIPRRKMTKQRCNKCGHVFQAEVLEVNHSPKNVPLREWTADGDKFGWTDCLKCFEDPEINDMDSLYPRMR